MHPDAPADLLSQLGLETFDDALGRRIVETHIWAVREGLRGAAGYDLFDGYCRRLVVAGLPLWRAHAAMDTLHPQWNGYGYTWRRDLNAIQPEQYPHGSYDTSGWLSSPLYDLIRRARSGEANPSMRRRLEAGAEQRDFPLLAEFFAAGATDYIAYLYEFGEDGDRSQGSGIVFSFTSDRRGGFGDDDAKLLQATLPALSLAVKADAGHVIASGLLGTYLGEDAGRRVHAGAVERGSVASLRAALWYADIRGFTPTSDAAPGPVIVELLNDVFEISDRRATPARRPGAQVSRRRHARHLLLRRGGPRRNLPSRARRRGGGDAGAGDAQRRARSGGRPVASVDLALHVGEVLYGNVGATDRLDFTVIGPAVNEVARIEALCEPLGRAVLASAEFVAAAMDDGGRLESLGRHVLRGVREPKEIFALVSSAGP